MDSSDTVVQDMVIKALRISEGAYCPYSGFRVGAAVLTQTGEVFVGCNIENASYGLSVCAERNAVFQAVTNGHRKIRAVVVVTPNMDKVSPCGACRQVINEFGPEAEIFGLDQNGATVKWRLDELLPQAFGPDNLQLGG